ncbi:MAG: hypothetical protein S4CHLAM7_13080 [Chlamydiae bacterium]|nr:hypothetical protein [Chlamydiota bacterium]
MNEKSSLFVVAVIALIIKNGKLLIMKRSPNKKASPNIWETLSGRLHPNENPYEGLLREIKEESGLEVTLEKTPFDVYTTRYLKQPMIALVFEAKHLSGEVNLSEEHSEFQWASINEFEKKTTLKRLLKSVKKLAHKIDN